MQSERKIQPLPVPDRLDSWKEIAVYLNRSERTVRRWETTEELPVHRLQHEKRGSVYAYTRELDAWRTSRRGVEESADEERTHRTLHVGWWWAAGALAITVLAVAIVIGLRLVAADAKVAERGTATRRPGRPSNGPVLATTPGACRSRPESGTTNRRSNSTQNSRARGQDWLRRTWRSRGSASDR